MVTASSPQALDAKAERRAARAERQKLRQKKAWRGVARDTGWVVKDGDLPWELVM